MTLDAVVALHRHEPVGVPHTFLPTTIQPYLSLHFSLTSATSEYTITHLP